MADPLLDRYELLQEIGKGGMGTVYRGRDRETGRPVAIKHLRADIADSESVERFRREGEVLRLLNHPNIVQLLDAVRTDGQHYLVMELIEGGSLRQKLDRTPRLEIREALSLSIEIADALARAHHLKIVHRDIKPANVLLAADGTPRLADFGIARAADAGLTAAGMLLGTLRYVSPEILQGKSADSRSDIWSFGVMLFEIVIGAPPFTDAPDAAALIRSILMDPVPDLESLRPDLPIALVDLIYRMLTKEPAERIASFRAVGAELESIREGRESGPPHGRAPAPGHGLTCEVSPSDDLPEQTTPFLGRSVEVTELKNSLQSPRVRLITILAQGGMGKTRLALEVARQVKNRFAQGVAFVPLASIESAEHLAQAIAEALHLSLTSKDDPKVQVLHSLRTREMLLVLDNFEHVLPGRSLVQGLLEAAPNVKILTTSRERLSLQGEVASRLTSMETAEWRTVDEALGYSAVQLFLQAARRMRTGFTLEPADLGGLTRICRLVEGLPLAILLAAGWVDTLSVEEIADEIEKSSSFLETQMHDVPERQRSMRSVVDSTWGRMSPAEHELFARLSVFRASFSREAAQEIAGAPLRALSMLISKSLLARDAESGRYHIHELLRQYAQEQLELSAEAGRSVRRAHGVFFATFMDDRWRQLKDHRAKPALQEIKDDIENVRAAWRYWLEERNARELRKFFESLWMTHEVWGWFRPAIDLFREAASRLEHVEPGLEELVAVRAYALTVEAWFLSLVGSPDAGIVLARESFEVLRQLDQDMFLPASGVNINAIFLGRLDEVEAATREMLRNPRYESEPWYEGMRLVWQAYAEIARGRFDTSQKQAEDAVRIFERLGNLFGLAVADGIILGAAQAAQGRLAEAKEAYERGLEAARAVDYRRVVQLAYDSLVSIALLEGRIDEARSYALTSLQITFENGQFREQLGSLRDMATVYKQQGNLEKAVELLAVVLRHPARDQNSLSRRESLKTEADRLLAEIQRRLSAELYKSAWERSRILALEDVVDGLLKENRDRATSDLTVASVGADRSRGRS